MSNVLMNNVYQAESDTAEIESPLFHSEIEIRWVTAKLHGYDGVRYEGTVTFNKRVGSARFKSCKTISQFDLHSAFYDLHNETIDEILRELVKAKNQYIIDYLKAKGIEL